MIELKVKRLCNEAQLPEYATSGSGAFDLRAILPAEESWHLKPGSHLTVPTGLAVEVPEGFVMLVFSRSGHGFSNAVRLGNCVGVIDSDYRGEVKVCLHKDDSKQSQGDSGFTHLHIKNGDRIAQAMLVAAPKVSIVEVNKLSDTARGFGGFGSTGT